VETCEATQPPAREKLNGGIIQVTANTRGVGAAIGRSLARQVDRVGWPDDVACVMHLFADGGSPIFGRG
jgi:hypothetical protein